MHAAHTNILTTEWTSFGNPIILKIGANKRDFEFAPSLLDLSVRPTIGIVQR